ncbi:MAG: hypothetical protein KC910_19020 [Candidatus Eremiobacteraeota bacterium]|nr:hypothetical protein [Candidatus Eremiobacteraeota bacterium]
MRTTALLLLLLLLAPAWARPDRPERNHDRTSDPKSHVTPTQQGNLQKLQSDLLKLKGESQVTQAQKDKLATDLYALADGAHKPEKATVDKLAADLTSAVADSSLSQAEMAKLMRDIEAVLNSAGMTSQEVSAVIGDAQQILASSNVDRAEVQMVVADLEAIAREVQKNVTESKPETAPQRRRR